MNDIKPTLDELRLKFKRASMLRTLKQSCGDKCGECPPSWKKLCDSVKADEMENMVKTSVPRSTGLMSRATRRNGVHNDMAENRTVGGTEATGLTATMHNCAEPETRLSFNQRYEIRMEQECSHCDGASIRCSPRSTAGEKRDQREVCLTCRETIREMIPHGS